MTPTLAANWYVVHRAHPGNPWGPFATRADAMRLRDQLLLDWPELQGCYSVRRAP